MVPIIVAIFLAFSAIGGGVVVVAHEAPASSPLHVVAVKSDGVFNTAQLPVVRPTTDDESQPTVSATPQPTSTATSQAEDNDDTPTATVQATLTPVPTQIVTAIATFRADIQSLVKDPDTHGQAWRGLQAKLDAASRAAERGDDQTAANILNAFAHELNAMERSDRITQDDYNSLYAQYANLLKQLNATPIPSVTPRATEGVEETATATPEKHEKKWSARADDQVTATTTPQPDDSLPAEANSHAKTAVANHGDSGNQGASGSHDSHSDSNQHNGSMGGNGKHH